MTESASKQDAQMMLRLAARDESVLRLPLPDEIFGFHAQQSCEKMMKALLSAHASDYGKTHDLRALAKLLTTVGENLPPLSYDLNSLQPFAVELRYDDSVARNNLNREAVIRGVEELRVMVEQRIASVCGDGE